MLKRQQSVFALLLALLPLPCLAQSGSAPSWAAIAPQAATVGTVLDVTLPLTTGTAADGLPYNATLGCTGTAATRYTYLPPAYDANLPRSDREALGVTVDAAISGSPYHQPCFYDQQTGTWHVRHCFMQPGTYTVSVTATDAGGGATTTFQVTASGSTPPAWPGANTGYIGVDQADKRRLVDGSGQLFLPFGCNAPGGGVAVGSELSAATARHCAALIRLWGGDQGQAQVVGGWSADQSTAFAAGGTLAADGHGYRYSALLTPGHGMYCNGYALAAGQYAWSGWVKAASTSAGATLYLDAMGQQGGDTHVPVTPGAGWQPFSQVVTVTPGTSAFSFNTDSTTGSVELSATALTPTGGGPDVWGGRGQFAWYLLPDANACAQLDALYRQAQASGSYLILSGVCLGKQDWEGNALNPDGTTTIANLGFNDPGWLGGNQNDPSADVWPLRLEAELYRYLYARYGPYPSWGGAESGNEPDFANGNERAAELGNACNAAYFAGGWPSALTPASHGWTPALTASGLTQTPYGGQSSGMTTEAETNPGNQSPYAYNLFEQTAYGPSPIQAPGIHFYSRAFDRGLPFGLDNGAGTGYIAEWGLSPQQSGGPGGRGRVVMDATDPAATSPDLHLVVPLPTLGAGAYGLSFWGCGPAGVPNGIAAQSHGVGIGGSDYTVPVQTAGTGAWHRYSGTVALTGVSPQGNGTIDLYGSASPTYYSDIHFTAPDGRDVLSLDGSETGDGAGGDGLDSVCQQIGGYSDWGLPGPLVIGETENDVDHPSDTAQAVSDFWYERLAWVTAITGDCYPLEWNDAASALLANSAAGLRPYGAAQSVLGPFVPADGSWRRLTCGVAPGPAGSRSVIVYAGSNSRNPATNANVTASRAALFVCPTIPGASVPVSVPSAGLTLITVPGLTPGLSLNVRTYDPISGSLLGTAGQTVPATGTLALIVNVPGPGVVLTIE